MSTLALLLLSVLPRGEVFVSEQATMLERNHVYSGDECERVFTQVLAWDGPRVWFWTMDNSGAIHPEYDHAARVWVLRWIDREGVCRATYSRTYEQRHLMYDIETADRELLPVESRRPLRRR